MNLYRMKKKLIEMYQKFLQNPNSEEIQNEIMEYEKRFGGLCVYNDVLKKQPIPKTIREALEGLSLLCQ